MGYFEELRRHPDRDAVLVEVEAVRDQAELGTTGAGIDTAEEIDAPLVVVELGEHCPHPRLRLGQLDVPAGTGRGVGAHNGHGHGGAGGGRLLPEQSPGLLPLIACRGQWDPRWQ